MWRQLLWLQASSISHSSWHSCSRPPGCWEICLETVCDVLYCKVLCGCWWWPQFVVCSVGLCWEKFCFADGELSRLHFPYQISDTRQYSDTKQPLLLLSDVSRRNEQKRLVDTSTFQVSKCGSCFIQSLWPLAHLHQRLWPETRPHWHCSHCTIVNLFVVCRIARGHR